MVDEDETVGKTPEECRDLGLWEVDPVYYSLNGNCKNDPSRNKRGKAYKARSDSEYKCFEAHDGVLYRPGDHVFIEFSQCDPYSIGTISNFKMTKRDQLSVKIVRFYRPEDVPEDSYSLLLQERQDDTSLNHRVLSSMQMRELFSSEISSVHPICHLRGKCTIRLVKDIRTLRECDIQSLSDTFFSLVSFDPNNSRLASVQGEIRVGSSYQAKLPPLKTCTAVDEPDRDVLQWRPGYINEESEHVYKRATRSFRMFAMVRNEQITQMERDFWTGDLCMHDASITLHENGYNVNYAIEAMNKKDEHMLKVNNFMTAEDAKKFARGIKMYGKNFLKIKKELLPHHERDELVRFYYGWKKTRDATRPKPLSRQRNTTTTTHRKPKNNQLKVMRPGSTDLADYASASETEMDELESDGRAAAYACHHCYSMKSKDWHHSGKERQLLCTDCRVFYKKYGQLRPVDRPSTVPPSLHKQKTPEEDEEEQGVRTRANKKERRETPSEGEKKSGSSPSESIESEPKQQQPQHRNGKRKRPHAEHINGSNASNNNNNAKKRSIKEEKEDDGNEAHKNDEPGTSHDNPLSANTQNDNREESSADKPAMMVENDNCENVPNCPATNQETSVIDAQSCTSAMDESSSAQSESAIVPSGDVSESSTEQQPSTSSAKTSEQEEMNVEEGRDGDGSIDKVTRNDCDEDNQWTVGNSIAQSTKNALLVRVIERRCGQMCARTDLVFRMKPGSEWARRREARIALKNNHHVTIKKNHDSNDALAASLCTPKNNNSNHLPPLSNTQNIEAFMGGRVPMNGTAVTGLPGMFSGIPDPRIAFLTPQQQYAFAYEQFQHQAFQKQMEQFRVHQQQLEYMRNSANGAASLASAQSRDTPSRGGPAPTPQAPPGFHTGFGMDPRAAAAALMHHHPQLAAQFGMAGVDGGHHAAAVMNALEQRNAIEQQQRLFANMANMEMLAQSGLPVSQAPPSHIHPHAAAMMQHAAAAAAAQPNGDALQLQQLLAMSAAAQVQQRPFMDQNPLLQISMMNPFAGNELAARMVAPGPLNSDMMRRLQQEGGAYAAAQRQ